MSKKRPLLKNMKKKICFLFFLNVIIICILWLNLKGVLVGIRVEKDKSLDIFEMTTNTSEPTIEFINRKLLIFKYYQVDVKKLNVHFNSFPLPWWGKHENMFPTFGFYARQILGIVGSQIENK
jgi:hypothetical protein